MSTAADMIKRSMRLLGALGQGESPTAQEASDGLSALNTMLDSWSTERLAVYQILTENFTWTGGSASVTIGTGGTFNTTRPSRIVGGFTRIDNIDYPFQVIGQDTYSAISAKTTNSNYPERIYYDGAYPLGTLYAYPVPSGNVDIHIQSWKQLQSFATLTTALSLPPGYQRAIEYNLAVEIAPEFSLPVPANVAQIANTSKSNIKRVNAPSMVATLDPAVSGGSAFNIYTG